jgi:hypothetical protein
MLKTAHNQSYLFQKFYLKIKCCKLGYEKTTLNLRFINIRLFNDKSVVHSK